MFDITKDEGFVVGICIGAFGAIVMANFPAATLLFNVGGVAVLVGIVVALLSLKFLR